MGLNHCTCIFEPAHEILAHVRNCHFVKKKKIYDSESFQRVGFQKLYQCNIYILSEVALDETNIPGCLHFSVQNIEMSCDLDRSSMWSKVNVSQKISLFITFA